jgi:hypothetical protein
METKKTFKELKQELKAQAIEIRSKKDEIKETFRSGGYAGNLQNYVTDIRSEFRHKHIAYCLIKGTKREEIETPAEDNLPNESRIMQIVEEYKNA